MTGEALVERVQKRIDDNSFDEEAILEYLNEGLFDVAALIEIPDLAELGTVETVTDDDNVALPDDYMRKVTRVESVTNEVNITEPGRSYEYLKFRRRHPLAADGSQVTDVAVRANRLFYYPTPEAVETLQVAYLKNPDDITFGVGPSVIPAHLQANLLVSYAAAQIFNLIEDGIEGAKINTDKQEQKYQMALVALDNFIGPKDSEPVFVADDGALNG